MSNPWEIKTVEYDKTNAEGNVEVSGYGQLSILLNKYVLKEKGKGLSSNDFTDNDKLKLDSVEVGAEKNKLETLTINGGTKIYPNDEKNINLPIPTKVSQLDNDLGYAKLINMSHDNDFSDSYVGKAKFAFQEEESLAIGKNAIADNDGVAIGKNAIADVSGVAIGADTSIDEVYDVNINNELHHNVEKNIWEGKITEADKAFKNDNGTNLTELDVVIENLTKETQNRIKADNVLQDNINIETQNRIDADNILSQRVSSIEEIIPSQASTSNKLADKAFVNSTVQTNTANFRGNWNTWSDIPTDINLYPQDYAGGITPTVNDYLVVKDASDYPSDTLAGEWRFKYTGVWSSNGKIGWMPEYRVNEEPFTSEQWFAINSGITSTKVSSYDSHVTNKDNPHSVTKSQVGLGSVVNTGDSAIPVSGGTTKFTTGGAYTELNKVATAISTAESNAKNLANATGTLAIAHGGTGVTTQADINKAFIGNLEVGDSDVTDGTEFVSSYASDSGFAEPSHLNKPYKRQFIKVWNYIKGKISSVLGLTKDNYGGKASTSGTADSAKNMYHQVFDLSSLDKTKFYPAFCYSGNNFAEVAIYSPSLTGSAKYNQNRIHFEISTHGWSNLPYSLNIREYTCFDNKEITIGCIGRGQQDGGWAIWLRGGLNYNCYTRNCSLSLKTSDYTYGNETYTVGTNYYGGTNSNVQIVFTPQSTITHGSYSSRPITAPAIKATINFIGDLKGNASTATTANSANKIAPNYAKTADLTTVTSNTIKYIKVADCAWSYTGTLQVLLKGNGFRDTLVINYGGGNATTPMLCGHYSGNSGLVESVIAQKGSDWNTSYSIYVKITQLTTCTVNVALLKGDCTINITESTTAPTNISEWALSDGFFGDFIGNASTATTADKATSVVDYGDTSKTIKIGYGGAGATVDNLSHIAGYLSGGTQIKDVSKDVLKSWIGLSNYLPLSGGTVTGATQFNNYVKLNAWTGYGTGTANFWYDGNNKFVEIQNATDLKLSGVSVATTNTTGSLSSLKTTDKSNLVSAINEVWSGLGGLGLTTDEMGMKWYSSNITSGHYDAPYYANGIWVISSANGIKYSTDGKTWTSSNITGGTFSNPYYANGIWVIGRSDGDGGIKYSIDGKTWSNSNITSGRYNKPYYANGIWVIGGSGIKYSTDGKTWSNSNITNDTCYAPYYANGIWVIGSINGIKYSTDGKTWTTSNITTTHYAPYYANGIWVIDSYASGIKYSTDGKTWSNSNITSGRYNKPYYANGIWVIGSETYGIKYSTDGKTWSNSNITSGTYNSPYYANGIWVIGSDGNSGVKYSTDGKTWTNSNITSGAYNSPYYANGIWVIGSDGSGIKYSTFNSLNDLGSAFKGISELKSYTDDTFATKSYVDNHKLFL